MILKKNNELIIIEDDKVLQGFAQSDVYKEWRECESGRFALYLAFEVPRGLGCFFSKCEFDRVFDLWCCSKFKYVTR